MNKFFPRFDVLHVVDHKGVLGKAWGGIVWGKIRDAATFDLVFPGCNSLEARISAVNDNLKEWERVHRVANRLPPVKRSMFFGSGKTSQFPVLQGPGVKAASERESVHWLLAFASRFESVDPSPQARHCRIVAESFRDWYKVIYDSGVVLKPYQYREQRRLVVRCLRSYAWLAWDARCEGRLAFPIVPKMHYWHELSLQARLINPRYVQTYQGESMVGRIAGIWKRSLKGPYAATVQQNVMRKYAMAFEVDLTPLD